MRNIFVAGHKGMVGSSIQRHLEETGNKVLTATRQDLDLTNQQLVKEYFKDNKIDVVYLAAARVGGILANSEYPAEFLYENLMIQNNVINSAYRSGIQRLLFLGSSCIYPKFADQPIQEHALLTGPLESTNEAYAIAKIAGIKMCESYNTQYGLDYRSIMPTNLYGPGDNFHIENSHVIPALLRRFHEAKKQDASEVSIWGSGSARREFLHVNDLAAGAVFIMTKSADVFRFSSKDESNHINIGTGRDLTILDLAKKIARVTGFKGEIRTNDQLPDGTPRKLLDIDRIKRLGWVPSIKLDDGLRETYDWFLSNESEYRSV